MQKILLIMLLALSLSANAEQKIDKKAIKQMKADIETVKGSIKSGKDLEKSEKILTNYISDSLFNKDITLYVLLADVVKKQYEQANEKLYLKESLDTAWLMNTGKKMFLACQKLDSIDAKPNEKGMVSLAYRKRNSDYLLPYRNNIFKGGLYFFKQKRWKEAWAMMDAYLDTRRQPLFSASSMDPKNDNYAAYVALVTANNMDDLTLAKKYADEALNFKPAHQVSLITLSELAYHHNDSIDYLKFLTEGYDKYINSEYFFPRLIDYYSQKSDYKTAMQYVDKALATDSLNRLFIMAKHSLLMDEKQYDDALRYGLELLSIDDSVSQVNFNVGFIYHLHAQNAMKNMSKSYRVRMNEAQSAYKRCKPYMERYRSQRPKDRQRWRPILYDVYMNLNMGKEFAEIEKE